MIEWINDKLKKKICNPLEIEKGARMDLNKRKEKNNDKEALSCQEVF